LWDSKYMKILPCSVPKGNSLVKNVYEYAIVP
jgi:hypothetical protein